MTTRVVQLVYCDDDLIAAINEVVRGRNGQVVGRFNNRSAWANPDLYDALISRTDFCPDDTPLVIRIALVSGGYTEWPTCKTCREPSKFTRVGNRFPPFCKKHIGDAEGINERKRATSIARYGYVKNLSSAEHRKQVSETMIARFGQHSSRCDEVKKKVKNTSRERYGVDSFTQTEEYKRKSEATNLVRYGETHHTKTSEYRERSSVARWRKLGSDISTDHQSGMPKQHIAQKYGYSISHINKVMVSLGLETDLPQNKIAATSQRVSIGEKQLREIVSRYTDLDVEYNVRSIIGREIDIFIPKLKIGFEYNGDYWHNDQIVSANRSVEKLDACEALGIKLITIPEYLFREKREFIEAKIASLLLPPTAIGARMTKVCIPRPDEVKRFLDQHHIQGSERIGPHRYALQHGGDIVSLATFSKTGELVRFCGTQPVIGGLSKLLKRAKGDIGDIWTFADRRFTNRLDNIYLKAGGVEIGITPPSYRYHRGALHLSRQQCMKSKLEKILKDFDPELSEYQNMLKAGWVRTFDCGNLKYRL